MIFCVHFWGITLSPTGSRCMALFVFCVYDSISFVVIFWGLGVLTLIFSFIDIMKLPFNV